MTVSTLDTRANYTGNGVLVEFSFSFKCYETTHIVPSLDAVEQSSGFTTVLNADQDTSPGGTVTFSVAPGSGVKVTLERQVPNKQLTDYTPYDAFPAETHETALDLLTMQQQETKDKADRAITAPVTDDGSVDYSLPSASAGKGLKWNDAGNGLENSTENLDDVVTLAQAAQTGAETAETGAVAAQTAAETAQTAAEIAQTGAETAETNAAASATQAAVEASSQRNIPARNTILTKDVLSQAGTDTAGMSTTIYTGNGTSQSINNGLDMATGDFGGLVWVKERSGITNHLLTDTVRGNESSLYSDSTSAEGTSSQVITSFDSTGFNIGNDSQINTNTDNYVAWSFQTTKKNFSSLGAELVTNGTFDTDVTGWTAGDAASILSFSSGKLRVTNNDATSAFGYQAITTETGKVYQVTLDITAGTSNGDLFIGTSAGAQDILADTNHSTSTVRARFVAAGTTTYIHVGNSTSTATQYAEFDNISVKEMVDAVPTNRNKPYEAHYNPDMNFSIVGYQGDGVDGHEIPHHLPVVPELSIFKNRDTAVDWFVQSSLFSDLTGYLTLSSTNAYTTFSTLPYIASNDTVRIGTHNGTNQSTSNIVSYHFASKSGVCKVGKYIGTGAAGNYVSTEVDGGDGFRPSLVINKNLTGAADWLLLDVTRGEDNYLRPNDSGAEVASTQITTNDNGFSLDGTSNNVLNNEYIYIAFADTSTELGTSLITGDDSTFDTTVGTWVGNDAGAGLSVSNGRLVVTNNDATTAQARNSFPTVAGKVYELEVDSYTNANTPLDIWIGTAAGTADLIDYRFPTLAFSHSHLKISFVAESATTHIALDNVSVTSGHDSEWDNITLKEVINPHGSNYNHAVTPTDIEVVNNTLISVANGHNDSGEVNTKHTFTGTNALSFGAGFENKKLYIYTDKNGNLGSTENRPLEGITRIDADKYGIKAKTDALAIDSKSRDTSKHFDYESDSGVVLASGESTVYYAWQAFDKDSNDIVTATFWSQETTTNSWLQYKHTEKRILKSWRMREMHVNTEIPKRFTIEGSNNGLDWTPIDSTYTTSDYVGNGAYLWGNLHNTTSNTTAYLYHRINITANNGHSTHTAIAELELNTISPSDYYLVKEGKMYDDTGAGIERVYLGEVITDSDGEVSSYISYEPTSKVANMEVHEDLTVYGEIENRGVCTAWVNFSGSTNPPLIRGSYNVKDIVDVSAGRYKLIFDTPMDSEGYVVNVGSNTYHSYIYDGGDNVNNVEIGTASSAHTPADINNVLVTVFGGKKIK